MKYIKPLAICLILFAVCGYYQRNPTEDDAWFAEESFWLLKEGKVKSEFFRGFLGWENQYFLSHKLFIALGAGFQYLLPLSPYTSKLSGLLFFGILVLLLLYYLRQNELLNRQQTAIWLLIVLVFSNTLLVKMSFENRPELMVATLGFASFLLLYKDPSYLKSALAGAFAALSALSHLNGLIYVIAGFILLLYAKKYSNVLVFGAVALACISLYFYDIWQFDGFKTWWYQFSNDPATRHSLGISHKLKIMVLFPKIFFESPEQAVLSLFVIVLGWSHWPFLRRINSLLVVYGSALFVSFWLLTKSPTAIYQVLFIPTLFVFVIELYGLLEEKRFSKLVYFTAMLYLCVGVIGNLQIISNNIKYLPTQMAELSTKITSKKTGLVPLTFFFNEYAHYERLLCQTNFELQTKQQKRGKPTKKLFFKWISQNNVDFVVLDYLNNYADYYPNRNLPHMEGYNLTYSDSQFAIYEVQIK